MDNKITDTWDNNDEDFIPASNDYEAEYVEDIEEEDEQYKHMYSPIQGSWYIDEYEDEGYQRKNRRMKIHSVKSYDEARDKERKKNQKKIRKEAQAREKQRQKYYHYDDGEDE